MAHDPHEILEQLAKDVEAAVHAMYRGEVRQATTRARTGQLVASAKAALGQAMGGGVPARPSAAAAASPSANVGAPVVAGAVAGWTADEANAVMRCITGWLPMGSPQTTLPETKCVAAGKMLVPTWGEREAARAAVRRLG